MLVSLRRTSHALAPLEESGLDTIMAMGKAQEHRQRRQAMQDLHCALMEVITAATATPSSASTFRLFDKPFSRLHDALNDRLSAHDRITVRQYFEMMYESSSVNR